MTNTWIDHKGRSIEITSMSNYWLNNIRKKFKGKNRAKIQPIMDEIKRRQLVPGAPKNVRRKADHD